MDGIIAVCAIAIGFRRVSLVITLVGDASEFITIFGIVIASALTHASANACSCVACRLGALTVLVLLTIVVDVRLIHVFMDGMIGITGITTAIPWHRENTKQVVECKHGIQLYLGMCAYLQRPDVVSLLDPKLLC